MRNNDKSAAPLGRLAEKAAALICVLALVLGISGCSAENKSISIYDLQKTMIAADENLPEMLISNSNEENAEKPFHICRKWIIIRSADFSRLYL